MSTEAPEILLAHYLKVLKLPTFQREHQKLARLCATEGVDHVGHLFRLAEREMIERDRRKVERRIKAARFPVVKSLDSFDFSAIPKLNKMQMQMLELARCEWIERRENVIALGPSGTGKKLTEAELFIHDVLNVFMCSGFTRDTGQYFMKASPVRPGDYLEFSAESDLLGALSACPGGDCSTEHSSDEAACYPLVVEIYEPRRLPSG